MSGIYIIPYAPLESQRKCFTQPGYWNVEEIHGILKSWTSHRGSWMTKVHGGIFRGVIELCLEDKGASMKVRLHRKGYACRSEIELELTGNLKGTKHLLKIESLHEDTIGGKPKRRRCSHTSSHKRHDRDQVSLVEGRSTIMCLLFQLCGW
jgi:hypothetical protein